MSAPAWLRRLSASSSDVSAGRHSDTSRPASSSDSFNSFPARAAAGGRGAARHLRRVAAALLLGLPLVLGFAAGAQADGILTISAPEAAPSTRSAIAEGNSGMRDLIFQVRLTSAVSAQVPFEVCFSGSATRGPTLSDDYQTLLGTSPQTTACVSSFIAAGHTAPSSAQTVGIRVVGDLLFEFDETVIAMLSLGPNPPWDAGLGTRTATHTILEDDTEVEFGESTIVGREGGRARIPVVLASKLPHSATIRFQYGGSATKWTDYDASNTSLTFRRGQTRRDLYINLPDDSDFDDNENVVVRLDTGSLPAGIQAGSTTQTTVTIKDNDYAISTDLSSYTVREDAGGASVEVIIDPPQDWPVGVRVGLQGRTATAGVDYLEEHHSFPNGVVTFRALQARKRIYIPVVNDGVGGENNEVFQFNLTQEDGAKQTTSNTNVVIKDLTADNRASRLRIAVDGSDTVREGQFAEFKLTMDRSLEEAATVAVGLAQKSDDGASSKWLAAPTTHAHYVTVEFAKGESEQTLSFTIANDGRDTNGSLEAVLMQPGLHPASSGPFTLYSGATSSAKVQIRDGSDGLRSPSTAPAVEIPITQVTNVQASVIDDASATVTWDAVEHATSYEVDWDGESADQQVTIAGVVPGITGTSTTIQHDAPEAMTLTVKVIPAYIDDDGDPRLLNDLAGTTTLDVGLADAPASACVSDAQWNTVEGYYASNSGKAPNYGRNWYRVLIAYGQERTDETLPGWSGTTARPTTAYTVAEARTSETAWSGWTPVREVLDCLEAASPPPPAPLQASDPELSLSAGPNVDEGDGATFTVHADPAPQSDLTVRFTVAQSGDWLDAPGAGSRTLTLPAGAASADLTVATVDDSTDEPDGSVSVTVDAGVGYTVAASPDDTASVAVADDDNAPANAYAALITKMYTWRNDSKWGSYRSHTDRWDRALLAFGESVSDTSLTPMTASEAQAFADRGWTRWVEVAKALHEIESGGTVTPDPVPEVTVSGGTGVTEGNPASFTVTANPAPTAPLAVTLTVGQSGDFTAGATGSREITVPPSGSVTLDIATVDDAVDEPDGSVSVTIDAGDGYTVDSANVHTVSVADDDTTPVNVPELSLAAGSAVDEGGNAEFTITANPAPQADLTVQFTVTQSGEYMSVPPSSRTVTLTAGATGTTVSLTTVEDSTDEADGSVSMTIDAGTDYTVALGQASGSVTVRDNDDPPAVPVVSIAAGAGVTEGDPASFTVTANPAPAASLTITLTVGQSGDYAASGQTGSRKVVVPTGGSVTVEVATDDDSADEPDGSITATLDAGSGYTVAVSPDDTASVEVTDNDEAAGVPSLSVVDGKAHENEGRVPVIIRLNPPSKNPVSVWVTLRESNPVSAQEGVDYKTWGRFGFRTTFRPGETRRQFAVAVINDSHDEDAETFEVVLSDPSGGAAISDGVGVMTIVNSDPMPAAWLARFGRTVAEQTLDGISGRMAASRTAGTRGSLAGQTLSFGNGGETDREDVLDRFGHNGFHVDPRNPDDGESRNLSRNDLLSGSSFTSTGEQDGSGGSLAFWGRGAQSNFDGREGTFSLDGETTTTMLGADYARDNWLVGLALTRSSGKGDYRDVAAADANNRPASQNCIDTGPLCNDAVREGNGKVKASLTAAIPYAAIQASERLKLWGALGYGSGEITLKPEPEPEPDADSNADAESYKSDIDWTMMAVGGRSELLPLPREGSGPAVTLTGDALWARTESEKTTSLAASDSDVTRLRLGLEGSWRIATEGDGSITPKLELGVRQDGGDAETGSGMELGAGIAWRDPGLGLSLDLSGRTLITHTDEDLENEGYSVSFHYDPRPASARGLALSLSQEIGGPAAGGLDALFAPEPLSERPDSDDDSRLKLEAAYGFPAFSGRYISSPGVSFGRASGSRDYGLGWRFTPVKNASRVSFGIKAVRRESEGEPSENAVGVEASLHW